MDDHQLTFHTDSARRLKLGDVVNEVILTALYGHRDCSCAFLVVPRNISRSAQFCMGKANSNLCHVYANHKKAISFNCIKENI